MLGDFIEAGTKLLEILSERNNRDREKTEAIAKHLNDIAECLKNIEEKLNNEKPITAERASLNTYTSQLSGTLNGMDTKIIDDLTQTLTNIPENISKEDVREIRTAKGQLIGWANIINNIGRKPPGNGKISRALFLSTVFGTAVSGITFGWWAGKKQNPALGFFDFGSYPTVNWNMESFLGTNQSTKSLLYNAPNRIIERIKQLTKGKFTIKLSSGNINNSGNNTTISESILNRVHEGEIDCGYTGIYYEQDKYRPLYFSSAIPFGLTPQQQTSWLLYKKNPNEKLTHVQKIYQELELNIIAFPSGGSGAQMGGWFISEINSSEDLRGIRMRIPGLGAEVLEKLGVKNDQYLFGTLIFPTKIVPYLQQGKLDAAEWIGPHDDFELGLHTVAKYYYYPGWWEPSTTFDLQVNRDAYNKLPDHYQHILKTVCWETYVETIAEYDRKNSEALVKIKNYGTELKRFPDDILKEAKQETEKLLTERSDYNPIFKEVYDEWKEFKNNIQDWHKYNQLI